MVALEDVEMRYMDYEAAGGNELFISIEDRATDSLIGYIRLRMPSAEATREEIDGSTALVRELHVYGQEVPVGKRRQGAWQHMGFGRKLLAEAEERATDAGANRVLVLSALGTKQYYRREGYRSLGPYMCKEVN